MSENKEERLYESPMIVTQTELFVLLDTLMGSLRIADGAGIFRFNKDVRHQLTNELLDRMGKIGIRSDTMSKGGETKVEKE